MNWSEAVKRVCAILNVLAIVVAGYGLFVSADKFFQKLPSSDQVAANTIFWDGASTEENARGMRETRIKLTIAAAKDVLVDFSWFFGASAVLASVSWVSFGLTKKD